MEAASGIAGIIKTILVLEKGVIPPIADLRTLNPALDASNLHVCVHSIMLIISAITMYSHRHSFPRVHNIGLFPVCAVHPFKALDLEEQMHMLFWMMHFTL
jgi:hypothetical protein